MLDELTRQHDVNGAGGRSCSTGPCSAWPAGESKKSYSDMDTRRKRVFLKPTRRMLRAGWH